MHVSSAIIQQPLNSAIASPNNAASSQDDVVVRASAKELNDSHLCPLLDRFIQFNVAINLQGCDFSVDQFSYLGHKIASAGISPDPKRLSPADIPSFDDVHVLRFIWVLFSIILDLSQTSHRKPIVYLKFFLTCAFHGLHFM